MTKFASLIKRWAYPNAKPVVMSASNAKSVVLILGWGGSNPWNFKKIQSHYADHNITTIQFTMPLLVPKFIRSSFESDLGKLVDEEISRATKENSNVKPRFLLHSFSNNGAWTFSNLLRDKKLSIQPERIIFDSAPWFIYKREVSFESIVLSQLFTSVLLGRPEYFRFPFTPIVRCVAYALLTLSTITDKIVPFKYYFFTNYFDMHAYLRDNFPIVPTLFICSSGDKLVPPKEILPFRLIQEGRGVPVQVHEFGEDVPHISAMFKCTDQYLELVNKFYDLSSNSRKNE